MKCVDGFVLGGLGGEVGKLEFEEDKAERVFKNSRFEVVWKILFQDQILDPADGFFVIAGFVQNFSGFLCVKLFEVGPPFLVSGARHRIGAAWDFPAADVLAAGGKMEFLGSIGTKF